MSTQPNCLVTHHEGDSAMYQISASTDNWHSYHETKQVPSSSQAKTSMVPRAQNKVDGATDRTRRIVLHRGNGAMMQTKTFSCPCATSHNCSATFTTSSHAHRHGRTHTGAQYSICPNCNGRFTRLDNMKQHVLFLHGIPP